MNNEEVNEEYLKSLFKDVRSHLDEHLKSRQIYDEDAYITFRCFLDGIHHKFTRLLEELLLKQENVYRKNTSDNERSDDAVIPLLLKLLWFQIHEPTFQWFECWFHDIIQLDSRRMFRSFRNFFKKMVRFFKTTHKYYYSIIECLCAKFNMNTVVPHDIFAKLNLVQPMETPSTSEKIVLDATNPLTFSIVISLQRCLINLGSAHFYKTLLDKPSSKLKSVEDFEKSIRYLNIASLCLPSVGDTYLQLAKIYLTTEKYSLYFFELARGSLVRIPSKHALNTLRNLILTPNFLERKLLMKKLKMYTRKNRKSKRLLFENSVVLQFLAILEHTMNPYLSNPSNAPNYCLKREYLQAAALEYHAEHVSVILKSLAAMMGSFDLMFTGEKGKGQRSKLKYVDLNERQVSFLNLSFDFIANVIDVVIKPSWQKNTEDFQYLAIIRLLVCWIKSYRSILQYAHRHKEFCSSMALLLNDLINNPSNCPRHLSNHRPQRSYYFEEDIMFREFSCINFALTDFNDGLVYNSPNMINNIIGCPSANERLSSREECILRIKSIIFSGVKFLEKNDAGITWNASTFKFELAGSGTKDRHQMTLSEISLKINIKPQQVRAVSPKKVERKTDKLLHKRAKIISVTQLEAQFANVRRERKSSPEKKKKDAFL